MKVIPLRVGLVGSCKSNFEYLAKAIKHENRYYYRVDDTVLNITKTEYDSVIINPCLYYFSTALKLHFLIEGRREHRFKPR